MKFLTIKKAHCAVLLVVLVAICLIVGVCYAVKVASSPKALYTIVIDAGHGVCKIKKHIGLICFFYIVLCWHLVQSGAKFKLYLSTIFLDFL